MAISLTLTTRNPIALTFDAKQPQTTWDEATYTWDDAGGTWNVPGVPLTLTTRNPIALTFDNKN